MAVELKWEELGGDVISRRAEVPGGWLVMVYGDVFHDRDFNGARTQLDYRIAMSFVPDQNHEWGRYGNQ